MRLISALCGASRRRLWAALLMSVVLNVGVAAYIIVYMPIMRLQPICTERGAFSIFAPNVEIDGEMAYPFFHHYHVMIGGLDHRVQDTRIYVPIAVWFDRDWLMNMSNKATIRLLAERTRAPEWDVLHQKVGLPEFDEVRSFEWPPCGAMRKLAIEGGEWAHIGPKPDPAVLKRRMELHLD